MVGADWSRDMGKSPWSRETLEDFERTLTRNELIREDSSQCEEIVTLLKAEREDPRSFDRYASDEKTLIVSLIDRFEGFC
jgi:hypothetical protein